MGFYNDKILPYFIDLSMRNDELARHRRRLLARTHGSVLEIGSGSGLNFSLYGSAVEKVMGLEPNLKLLNMSRPAAGHAQVPVSLVQGSALSIPADAASFDVVLSTWTLCSIPDVAGALKEMRRVLKSEGEFLFLEHGLAPEEDVRRWQNRLTPLWKRIGGGCHLNRDVGELVTNAGFSVAKLEKGYVRGPRPLAYMYEGQAKIVGAGPASIERSYHA